MPRIRFGLLLLLIVITLIGLTFAWISFKRDRGTDRLVEVISNTKEREGKEITDSAPFSMERQEEVAEFRLSKKVPSVKNSTVDEKTFVDRLLANVSDPVSELNLYEALIDQRYAHQLNRNHAAPEIAVLRIRSCDIESDAVPFFQEWQLRQAVVHNTEIPESWVSAFASAEIHELTIVGDCGLLTVDALVRCMEANGERKGPKVIQVCNGVTTAMQLRHWQETVSHCKFQAVAFAGDQDVEISQPLSGPDPVATENMEAVWKRLHRVLKGLDPPALNEFNPPATDAQIAELENLVGIPLHPTLRAYLKVHNGQPSSQDELVSMEKLLSIKEIIGEYGQWQSYGMSEERTEYDFNPDYDSWVNPNVIPVGTSEDHIIGINQITGKVVYWWSEQRELDHVANDIQQYFDNIADQIEAREFGGEDYPEDFNDQKVRVWRK